MLLDVDMPFLDGMTAAGHIRRVDPEVVIVFVTNLAQYAIQGYSVNALDYILKPLNYFSLAADGGAPFWTPWPTTWEGSADESGNSVLDTVLTGKSLYCARHGIELTCVADGARLDFMDIVDICSIFGNLLDNAIECELNIQDKKKRLIHLAVYAKKDFLIIQCGNYCGQILEFQDGIPISTKGDGAYHGFGVKSIRYTAGKYGGTVTIHNQNSWFEMNIVIPVKTPVV